MSEATKHGPLLRIPIQIVAVVCFLIIQGFYFKDVLFAGAQFGYQDAADFYYPLYQRVQQEWSAGRFPLWEPEENGGMPLLGNPTSAVLYPGKLIYAILPYPWAARIYPLAHILLAAVGTYTLARFSSVSPTGACIAMLGFACGAPLIHSTSNVIFLVGAAWTPFAWLAIDGWIRLHRVKYLLGLGFVLCMQVLGGDTQAAYLEILASLVYVFLRSRKLLCISVPRAVWLTILAGGFLLGAYARSWGQLLIWGSLTLILTARIIDRRRLDLLSRQLLGLAGSCTLALLLAGVQLIPSAEFIGQTTRLLDSWSWGHEVYRFSASPFELLGSLFPGWCGSINEGNTVWLRLVPPTFEDTEFWFPSLFLGLPTLMLALAAASIRSGNRWRNFLTVVLLIGVMGGMGSYASPLPWLRWLLGPESPLGPLDGAEGRSDDLPGDGMLSPYWVMTILLPGFRSFRYPAKLLLPASLALACLAGYGWDLLATSSRRRVIRYAEFFTIFSLVLLCTLYAGQSGINATVNRMAELGRSAFGPLDAKGTVSVICSSVMHGTVVSGMILLALKLARPSAMNFSIVFLLGMSADLILANRSIPISVPQKVFESRPEALKIIEEAETSDPAKGPFRIHRLSWSPSIWSMERSNKRPEEIVQWDRDTLRCKYAVPLGMAYAQANGTAELIDQSLFFGLKRFPLDEQTTRKFGLKPGQQFVYRTRRGFDLWNTRYFILPYRLAINSRHRGYLSFLPNSTAIYPKESAQSSEVTSDQRRRLLMEEDLQVFRNDTAFPRAWIVHKARCFPEIRDNDLAERERRTDEILYQDDDLWHVDGKPVFDPRVVAWVETSQPEEIRKTVKPRPANTTEIVDVSQYKPQRVVLKARLTSPGIVVLADVFYPGWELRVDGEVRPIYRTNRAMRGALVESGIHTLVYEYKPRSVRIGALLSGLGLLMLSTGLVVSYSRKKASR